MHLVVHTQAVDHTDKKYTYLSVHHVMRTKSVKQLSVHGYSLSCSNDQLGRLSLVLFVINYIIMLLNSISVGMQCIALRPKVPILRVINHILTNTEFNNTLWTWEKLDSLIPRTDNCAPLKVENEENDYVTVSSYQ